MIIAIMDILSRNKRLLIASGVLLLANTGLFLFIEAYQSQSILADQARWNDLRRQVALIGKADVSSIYKQGIADLETIKGKIPPKRQFPRLLDDILKTASFSRVSTGTFSYRPVILKDRHLSAHEISMSVSGGYLEVKCFLAELLESDELLIVESIALANSDPFEEKVIMDLKLTVYLREEA